MLGDTAVAINGDDPRYAHLHGCHVVLPLSLIHICSSLARQNCRLQ